MLNDNRQIWRNLENITSTVKGSTLRMFCSLIPKKLVYDVIGKPEVGRESSHAKRRYDHHQFKNEHGQWVGNEEDMFYDPSQDKNIVSAACGLYYRDNKEDIFEGLFKALYAPLDLKSHGHSVTYDNTDTAAYQLV